MKHKRLFSTVFSVVLYLTLLTAQTAVAAYADEGGGIDTGMLLPGVGPEIIPEQEAQYYDPETGAQQTETARLVLESASALDGGWYVVDGEIDAAGPITVTGDVDLILNDDAVLRLAAGLTVAEGGSLTIWSQSPEGKGSLEAARQAETGMPALTGKVDIKGGCVTAAGVSGEITVDERYGHVVLGGPDQMDHGPVGWTDGPAPAWGDYGWFSILPVTEQSLGSTAMRPAV